MRRLLAIILSISLVLQMVIFFALAENPGEEKQYAGVGDYTVSLQADPTTYTAPADFGTTAANGKVWTDKSVVAKQNGFEVTLSALAQEYISEDNSTATSSVAADVVMILDFSGSMEEKLTLDNEEMTRTKAMIKAVNEALEIIMMANENNRVLIYTYQSDNTGKTPDVNELLPLGHYTNTAWSKTELFSDKSGKYFDYSSEGSRSRDTYIDIMTSSSNLKKDGRTFTQKTVSTAYGTCTQHGIFKGVQTLATAIGQEEKTVDRKPYIMLFTDGAPGNATDEWYNSASTGCGNNAHDNDGSAKYSALSVLSATYMKNTLDTAYRAYNGKDMGIEWFNVGLGVGNNELGTLFLQPNTIANGTSDNAAAVRTQIATYTSGQYSAYSAYADAYTYTVDAYIVNTGDDLQDAFTELAGRIEEETKTITSPIISVEGATSDLTFTDVLGSGMGVSNITLHPDADTEIFGIATGNTYTFTGYDMTATVTTDSYNRKVLTWNIPAKELAVFAFANRSDPTDGNYDAADPIRLTYDVRVADPAGYEGTTLYSNTSATVQFSVPNDNTYYFEPGNVLKSDSLAAKTKNQNITGTTEHVAAYAADQKQNSADITVMLGNNGKLAPAILLDKSAENSRVEIGKAVTFTLSVTNKGQANLTNVVITDTLPEGLTYQADSVQNATVAVEGATLAFTIPAVSAGQTVLVTYDVVLDANAGEGETFTNTAAVTRINAVDVYGPVETTETITAYHTYRVIYDWTGTVPAGQILPTDNNRYTTGAYYAVDTNHTSQTKIENKDRFGNVTERWTFSGWTDPNSGVMGNADVTVRGVWNYESFLYPDYRVIYTWSGDIPPGKTLPTDENSYIRNQPYAVDSTFTAATVIPTYDAYGNINGRYTFSGWADPNRGVMGDADVTIPGVWTYESVTVPTYRVFYTWTGAIPEGHVPPVNNESYAPNQTYPVDTTYPTPTVIFTYDTYGNINGQYTFLGWEDPNHGVMGNADVTISGVWQFEPVVVPEHRVFYVWSGEVPPSETLPTDGNTYVKNQPYTVDGAHTAATVIPTYDVYGNLNGRYTFSGWTDPGSGVMGEADVVIHGIWEYETIPVETHNVIYVWTGNIPDNVNLPIDSKDYVPNQPYTVDTNYTSSVVITTIDAYGNVNGRYTFSGWTDPGSGVMGNADVTVRGVWEYETVTVPSYRVQYVWTGEIPPQVVLPTDSNTYVKNQPYAVDDTHTAVTVIPTYDTYGNVNGRYTFTGWTDPGSGVMGEADVTIEGVWAYETLAVPSHRVLYVWTGDIPDGHVPPNDTKTYVKNQPYAVDSTYTAQTKIEKTDLYGNLTDRYTFSGWTDPGSGVMGEADVTIRGVWVRETFTYPAHRVIYTWSGAIPSGKVLPVDNNSYIRNQPYVVDSNFTAATRIPTYDSYGNLNGRYAFSGWNDPNRGVMGDTDVTIPGVWTYETVQVPTYRVIYTWSGTIPAGHNLPTDGNSYVTNQQYSVDTTYTTSTVIPSYDAYGNVNGRYTFSGWEDTNHGVMGNADVTIPGIWQYESENVVTHRVFYVWSGEVPPTETLPTNNNTYVKNQRYGVDSTYTATTVIPTYDAYGNINGRYTFSGWEDPNNGKMGDEDVTIRGVWEYETVPVVSYNVHYVWTGDIPNGLNPPADPDSYVPGQSYPVDDLYTAATQILTYDAYGNLNGRYTFSGWTDPNSGVMGEADVTIEGVWAYETISVPTYRVFYEWTGEIPPQAVLPTDSNTYVKNQPYSVDITYTSATEIFTFAKARSNEGTINGRYTFSGWADPNNGVMGEADVTISGVWKFESIEQPPEETPVEPGSPDTGEILSTDRLILIWTMSVNGIILVSLFFVKKKKEQ